MSTASTAALGSLLSAFNNGSTGINVASTVAAIIAADRAPEQLWQSQQATLNNQSSAIQQIESDTTSVTDSLQSLSDVVGVFSNVAANSSAPSVVTASAEPGTAAGNHTIVVDSLATFGSAYSSEQASSSAALPGGSFSITVGSGTAQPFTIGSGVNTLDQLAAAINTAAIGVSASVVTDANGARLALVSQNSGTAAGFTISGDTSLSFTQTAAQDASLHVDGVPITSASNTVTGAISGLTLNLVGTNTSATPATIAISPDTSTIQSTLSSFVSAYNTLVTTLNQQFTYNSSSSSEGVLSADSTARSLQSDVLSAANLSIGTGSLNNLTSLGITTNQDGTLTLNTQALGSALSSNYQGVVNFFQGVNGSQGFASTVTKTLSSYTDPSQGAFTVDLQSINNENQDLTNETSTFELYIATQQTVLTNEYNNANIALQQLPQTIKNTQVLLGDYSTSSTGG